MLGYTFKAVDFVCWDNRRTHDFRVFKDSSRVQRTVDILRKEHYENVLGGLANATMEIIRNMEKTNVNPNLNEFERQVEFMRIANYSDPSEKYGVILTRPNCTLVSYSFGPLEALKPENNFVFTYKRVLGLVNRRRNFTKSGQFKNRDKILEALSVKTSGILFTSVDSNTAQKSLKKLLELQKFSLAAVFVFDSPSENCVAANGLELLRVTTIVSVGGPFSAKETSYYVAAVLGF
ncbi:hypothetical protein L596_022515 [Steinernema carpocapsae]|uniref:Uncharacterized protein n=1 Tax=Steinernema carpocapsae TaxID=34508 RepID=A0A4U5MMB8_STECR|nr:hypothetical protein L596_022515 [Steinernema carpocapsae]